MPKKLPPEVRAFFAATGAQGGRAGKGAAKKRGDKAYYQRIAKLAVAARKRKALERKKS